MLLCFLARFDKSTAVQTADIASQVFYPAQRPCQQPKKAHPRDRMRPQITISFKNPLIDSAQRIAIINNIDGGKMRFNNSKQRIKPWGEDQLAQKSTVWSADSNQFRQRPGPAIRR